MIINFDQRKLFKEKKSTEYIKSNQLKRTGNFSSTNSADMNKIIRNFPCFVIFCSV